MSKLGAKAGFKAVIESVQIVFILRHISFNLIKRTIINFKMALYNVMLLGELFFSLWSSRTMFKLMTAVNLYCICYDAYVAFYTLGLFAYTLVLMVNLPYLLGLIALVLNPHSVFRRRVLF